MKGAAAAAFNATGRGYLIEQSTRSQTLSYAPLDSTVALAGLDAGPPHRPVNPTLMY